MKTVTLDRYHVFGTRGHAQRLMYMGKTIHYWHNGNSVYLTCPCNGHETIKNMLNSAQRMGFTHVRFVGDWDRYTVRKKMKIPQNPYFFNSPSIADIISGA